MSRPTERQILYRLLFSGDGFIADLVGGLIACVMVVLALFVLALFF